MAKMKLMATACGSKFGEWEVLAVPRREGKRTFALCRCSCGTERDVDLYIAAHGQSRSCGCLKARKAKAGDRYGKWELLEDASGDAKVPCRCDCGTIRSVSPGNLVQGSSGSCGCAQKEKMASLAVHGDARKAGRARLYGIWCAMRSRCTHSSMGKTYLRYGGRGIKVCREWESYETFRAWAMASGYADDLTIERKRVDGDYCPDNCTWIAAARQARNRSDSIRLTAFGETKSMYDWAEDPRARAKISTIRCRIQRRGWTHEEAIATPRTHKHKRAKAAAAFASQATTSA